MKFYNINKKDLGSLLNVIDKCEGTVELISKDGSKMDAKKNLTTLKKVSNTFAGDKVPVMELRATNPNDNSKLVSFMMRGIA